MDEAAQKVARAVGVDAPRPTHVHPDVTIVLCEGDQFIVVRIGDVHQDEFGVRITGEEFAHVPGGNPPHRHAVVSGVVAGVNLERQVMLDCQFNAPRPAPIAEAESGLEVYLLSAQRGCERG